ncbi:hypothetical protein R1flu_012490 [Riccia fluitans]|uniref:Uncharacterized protein n=1 Tax=Riccia fluitans TaxID=41844 RepID=A0ABD1ZB01_9MARC
MIKVSLLLLWSGQQCLALTTYMQNSDVKALDMFDSDDDYHPSLPSSNTQFSEYFPMPPTLWNSSYNVEFFREDDYFLEPPSSKSVLDGVTIVMDDEYVSEPPPVPKMNYSSLKDKEDEEYDPEPPIYPKFNYSSEDNQDQ